MFSSSNSAAAGPVTVKPNYTMGDGGHEKGINCIDFYGGSDRPFLVTGSDDQTVRIWDYHTKSCVRVLEGHTNNVSAVIFHPQLPFLLSAGEDATLRIWNAQTFRPEASYNFGMERAWGLACCRAHNSIGIAFDSGSVVFQLGRGDPCASIDPIQGRLVWSRARGSGSAGSHGNEILTGMVRLLDVEGRPIRVPADGEIIPLTPKELGTSDVFPQNLQHSPDGRLVAVWGDGEYVIYSTIGWRNRAFGKGAEIAWAAPGGDIFASRDSNGRVMINRVSAHDQGVPLQGIVDCDKIYGGPLLGVSIGGSTLSFYDWTGDVLIRTIDVSASAVTWSPDASHVAIQTESSCYILSAKAAVIKSPQSFPSGEEGIEDSLELVDELEQPLKSVCWISGNCFVYLTEENRLAYHVVGGDADESFQLALFDRSHFLLGFLPGEQRVYLTDQDLQVSSYTIMPALITFQSAVLAGGDLTKSLALLENIPANYYARLAVFLQRRGYLREALKISPDAHFQFELAVQLNDLNLARELLQEKMNGDQGKWQELGKVALKAWNLPIAEEALHKAGDLASLFLLYAAAGDTDGLIQIAREAAKKSGHVNLAFAAYVKAGAYVPAFELLLSEGRAPEAALFARTYGLSAENVAQAVEMWRRKSKKEKVAAALADPLNNPEKFAGVSLGSANVVGGAPVTPRGRSVSFDGNVSVAGSSSTISLKQANGDISESAAQIPIITNANAIFDDVTSMTSEKYQTDASDDQMSLEVNTAGTGTRLEDLDEETEEIAAGYEEGEEEGVNGRNNKYNGYGLDDIEEMEPEYESSIVNAAEELEEGEDGAIIESEYINVCENEFEGEPEYEAELEEYTGSYEGTYEEEQPESLAVAYETVVEPEPESESVAVEHETVIEPEPVPLAVAYESPYASPTEFVSQEQGDDDLLAELETLHVTDTFNEAILEVVEDGGDVYEVNEPEYPVEEKEEEYKEDVVGDYTTTKAEYSTEYTTTTDFTTNNTAEYNATNNNGYASANEYSNNDYYGYSGTDNINEYNNEYPADEYPAYPAEYTTEEYPAEYSANTFSEYPATYNTDNDNLAKKEKGSDSENVHEEIDFGGEGDADGWL